MATPTEEDRRFFIFREENRRFALIGLFVLVLLCLVAVLIVRIFFTEENVAQQPVPVPAVSPTSEESPVAVASPEVEENTPTPTRVIGEQPTTEATEETPAGAGTPTAGTPPAATATPAARPLPSPGVSSPGVTTVTTRRAQIGDILKNGDFEEGFDEGGVGLFWDNFQSNSVIVFFAPETNLLYIESGDRAQRITVLEATQGDRYAGIYQPVEVVPGGTYTLTLHGQIRTGLGDINLTSYGYRMQYAIDYEGGADWQAIDNEDWVELPWDEQLLTASDVQFLSFTTPVTATSDELTLFIRSWNKWANPAEVQYTLDSLSLVGPLPGTEEGAAEALIDQPLPTTGAGDGTNLAGDGRFWGAVIVLLLLAAGAVYRARWEW